MIRELIQTTLDNALHPDVLSYWQRKSGDAADEYIVYSVSGDPGEFFADDQVQARNANVTIHYYYRSEMMDTAHGRLAITAREDAIEAALRGAGILVPFGRFDAGDVDDVGYFVTVFEAQYWRVV